MAEQATDNRSMLVRFQTGAPIKGDQPMKADRKRGSGRMTGVAIGQDF
jgi:hypothetical protein